jgi:hypothetical protein
VVRLRVYHFCFLLVKHTYMKRLLLFCCLINASVVFAQQGFFLNDHDEKEAVKPEYTEKDKPVAAATVQVSMNFDNEITPVSKYVFGNNANVYMTQMVDQPVLLDYIRDLAPNVIRFPGGNLSSVYFWNAEKNVPPADAPAQLLDGNGVASPAGYWYGKNNEGWTASLDSYYEMLALTGNTGILTINYGYARYGLAENPVAAAAHLAAEWVRYDNGRTKYWEIGNESNGSWQAGYRINTTDNQDGQPSIINGELYGKHFKVFADSMHKAATEKGFPIYIGAQLLQEAPAAWWNNTDRFWNAGIFTEAANTPDYYIIHSYYTPYNENSTAATILATATTVTEDMMEYVTNSMATAGVTQKPVALTEWNIFAVGSKQMISYINGMHAAIVTGELIKNKYGMASRWDLANGYGNGDDHGTFSQGNEPGIPQWNPRPSFFYMHYFQKYFGDTMVETNVAGSNDVLAYGSSFSSGESSVVIVNKGTSEKIANVNVFSRGVGARYYYYTLTGGTDNGEFSVKVNVNGTGPTLSAGGPANYETLPAWSSAAATGIKVSLPARSVTYVLVDDGDNIITGTNETKKNLLKVLPNPTKGPFEIEVPMEGQVEIQMVDIYGRLLYKADKERSNGKVVVDASLPSGFYIVRVVQGGKVYSEKVVIE